MQNRKRNIFRDKLKGGIKRVYDNKDSKVSVNLCLYII